MALQTQVGLSAAQGVPGEKASLNPAVYYPNTLLAEGAVTVGSFVFAGTDPQTQAKNSGASGASALGFVERNIVYYDFANVLEDGTLVVPDSSALTIATRGDFWAVSASDATVGQKVFAVLADGSLKTGAAQATVAGAVETGFVVMTAGEAGEVIIISTAPAVVVPPFPTE
jgi:hypothetical protein